MARTPTARFFIQARGLRRTTLLIEAALAKKAKGVADPPLMAMVQQIDEATDCGKFFPAVVDVGIDLYLPI